MTLTRRQVLELSALAAASVFLPPAPSLPDFLHPSPPLQIEDVVTQAIPIDTPQPIAITMVPKTQREELHQQIKDGMYAHAAATQRHTIRITEQCYISPLKHPAAARLQEYCQKAENFLYAQLPSLSPRSINWTIAHEGDDYTLDCSQKGFIGRKLYRFFQASASNTEDSAKDFSVQAVRAMSGGLCLQYPERKIWYLSIVSGPEALQAPFSEMLPLHTLPARQHYALEAGQENATIADEAITEAISYVLACQLAGPLETTMIDQTLVKMQQNQHYRSLPQAIEWIHHHSPSAALELYLQSPAEFMEQIHS